MPSVYLARRLPGRTQMKLAELFDLVVHDSDWPPTRDELLRQCAGRDGVITMFSEQVDDELLDAAGRSLRVVANYAVRFDNIDLQAASRRGVIVTNTPDVLSRATAELTIALVLALMRRVAEGDRFLRSRARWFWSPSWMIAPGLAGRTLGVVGLGRIGLEVARLARALGMRVVYTRRSGATGAEFEWMPLEELLETADVVSLHCPLTAETRHLVNADTLRLMRRDAFLVNTTRGQVVDEAALAEALAAGVIAGAALDVFEREPEVHEALLPLDNVLLTPHLGSGTLETRDAMGDLCIGALRGVLLEGRCPPNALNAEAWRARAPT